MVSTAPHDARTGVIYCPYPHESYRHFFIGSDGSIYNSQSKRWLNGNVDMALINQTRLVLTVKGEKQLCLARAHAVLIAHGHPRPSTDATAMYRDDDRMNDSLENLSWQSTDAVLQSEIAAAAARGESLEFRQLSRYPSLHIGSDGRVWSSAHEWLSGQTERRAIGTTDHSNPSQPKDVNRHRDQLVWEAFTGQPLKPGMMLQHIDGDGQNCRFTNLREVTSRPTQRATAASDYKLVDRPPGVPPATPTLSLAAEANRCQPPPPGAAAGVTYAHYPHVPYQHFLIGTDGSVFNPRSPDLIKWAAGHAPIDTPTNPIRVHLKTVYAEAGASNLQIALAELVLTTHGHPRPNEPAIARYRDENVNNHQLSNLYWETTAAVLEREVAAAASLGIELEFRTVARCPGWWIGRDGRVWSSKSHGWLRGYISKRNGVNNLTYTFSAKDQFRIPRPRLVWEAFTSETLHRFDRISFRDRKQISYHFDNLTRQYRSEPKPTSNSTRDRQ
jgi:hypothetical protein